MKSDTVEQRILNAFNEIEVKDTKDTLKMAWPTRDDQPVSEMTPGFFTKAFPWLFPDGKADFTRVRLGKTPSMAQWIQHLLKVDRRFAKDPIFIMVVTNTMQKKQALAMGTLYADKCVADNKLQEVKEKLQSGDKSILRNIYCYSNCIKGSQPFFSGQISKAYSFLRHIRINSNDTKMFDLFLTFSAADNHWYDLHKKLPGSEKYLDKILVKKESDIPADADKDQYITEPTDYLLRKKNIDENQDIVNAFFQKRIQTLWETTLKPKLGGEEYIRRYEFQMRHAIHCHMIITMKNGPSCKEMETARSTMPDIPAKIVVEKESEIPDGVDINLYITIFVKVLYLEIFNLVFYSVIYSL